MSNKRKCPATKALPQKFLRIMDLAMRLNSACTESAATGDKPTVFVEFSGHVCQAVVRVYSRGWTEDEAADIYCECHLDDGVEYTSTAYKTNLSVDQMIDYLQSMVDTWCKED